MDGLVLYNTRTRRKEPFRPLEQGTRAGLLLRPHRLRAPAPGEPASLPVRGPPEARAPRRGLPRDPRHQHHRRRSPHRRRRRRRRQDGAGGAEDRPPRRGDRRRVHRAVAAGLPAGQLPRGRCALQGHRAHPRADRDGPDARGEGLHLPDRGRRSTSTPRSSPATPTSRAWISRCRSVASASGRWRASAIRRTSRSGSSPRRAWSDSRSGIRPGAGASRAGTSSARR